MVRITLGNKKVRYILDINPRFLTRACSELHRKADLPYLVSWHLKPISLSKSPPTMWHTPSPHRQTKSLMWATTTCTSWNQTDSLLRNTLRLSTAACIQSTFVSVTSFVRLRQRGADRTTGPVTWYIDWAVSDLCPVAPGCRTVRWGPQRHTWSPPEPADPLPPRPPAPVFLHHL